MRVLGIDFGTKRIGIAVSDPSGLIAQPAAVVENIAGIKQVFASYDRIDEIVVGLPKKLSGEIGEAAQKVLAFAAELKKTFTVPVITWDERLTTAEAERMLISAGLSREKRKKVIDKSAAAYILQNYLDSKRR